MDDVYDFKCREASRRFIEIRIQAGMTQEQLAEKLGVSLQTIKNYEKAGSGNVRDTATDTRSNAIAGMKIETLFRMAKLFNVSADYLMCISDIKSSDYDIQKVHEFTGLSQDAIESIVSIMRQEDSPHEKMDILNWLFSSGWLSISILERLEDLGFFAQEFHAAKIQCPDYSPEMGYSDYSLRCKESEDALELSLYRANKTFNKLMEQFVDYICTQSEIEKWDAIASSEIEKLYSLE